MVVFQIVALKRYSRIRPFRNQVLWMRLLQELIALVRFILQNVHNVTVGDQPDPGRLVYP